MISERDWRELLVHPGIAGAGAMTRDALPILQRCGYEISALCGTVHSQEVVKSLCDQHQIPLPFTDYGAIAV